jgi:hypothetical protein
MERVEEVDGRRGRAGADRSCGDASTYERAIHARPTADRGAAGRSSASGAGAEPGPTDPGPDGRAGGAGGPDAGSVAEHGPGVPDFGRGLGVGQPADPDFWTEADLYFKLNAVWWEVLSTSVTYTYYTSPNDTFTSYSDVGLGFALSDSKWLGAFSLNPSILFAFETTGEALVADDKKGIYMGIGLAPGYTFFADSAFPVNISAPMTFGFSLKDYYTVNGVNQTFGFFSGGPLITLPLKFIPSTLGNWSLKAGVQFLVLNSNLKAVNTNDGFVPIGSVGLSLTY